MSLQATLPNDEAPVVGGFEEMGLRETTLAALARVGYTAPSPIQQALVALAVTGPRSRRATSPWGSPRSPGSPSR